MSVQTPLEESREEAESPLGEVTSQASSLAYDLITLTELQASLLFLDVREAGRRGSVSLVLLAVTTVFSISAVPVCLIGISEALVDFAAWRRPIAYLLVGVLGALAACLGAIYASRKVIRITSVFGRSLQEFHDNMEFVKGLVRTSPNEHQML